MKLFRVFALIKRYFLSHYKTGNRIFTLIYWLSLNIVIWGTTSVWIQKQAHIPNLVTMVITSLILWQIVFRVNIETAKSLFNELVSNNLINLYTSPLKLSEWIVSIMALGIIDMTLIILLGTIISKILFNFNLLKFGWLIIPSTTLLLIFGWSIGFIICGFLIYFKCNAHDIVYSFGYIFVPFSAVYCPVDSLPYWIAFISKFLPSTYIFESIRFYLLTETISFELLMKSFGLNCIYFITAILFLKYMFKKSKIKGLTNFG